MLFGKFTLLCLLGAVANRRPAHKDMQKLLTKVASRKGDASLQPQRVAVVVSGSLKRYFLESTLTHLIQPLARQGHYVGYYLALCTGEHKAWRDAKYMQELTWDPLFGKPSETSPESTSVERVLKESMAKAGGSLRHLHLRESMPLDDDKALEKLRQAAKLAEPAADADSTYPMVSLGSGLVAEANRNALRLYRAMEQLWDELEQDEQKDGQRYDYVLFLRDDAHFLNDFDLAKVIGKGPADLYVLSCDAREHPMLPTEINDHSQFFGRDRAPVVGRLYSWLTTGAAEQCKVNGRRCISEELLRWRLEEEHVQVRSVGQGLIPFQRCAHVVNGNRTEVCMHKYCNSKEESLPRGGLELCSNLGEEKATGFRVWDWLKRLG